MKWLLLLVLCGGASATNAVYVAQNAAGGNTGTDCADAKAASYFNSGGNWSATPSGIQIGPDTTVHLCGSITSALTVQGAGTSGHPVIIVFESGAGMTSAAWNTTAFSSGGFSFITLNGQNNGTIQNTANGTTGTFANSLASIGVDFSGSSSSTIENLTISNIYVRTANSTTDNSAGANGNRCILWGGGSNNTITNVTTHDCRFNYAPLGTSDSNWTITFNTGYNMAAHFWVAPGNTGSTISNITYANNTFHDPAPAWDSSPSDYFHIDGFHFFCQASSTCSGLYIYNNYFYGSFGVDYTAQIFTETDTGTNAAEEVYNNLIVNTTTTQSSNGAIDLQTGASGLIANNTIVGSGSANGGVGMQIIQGTSITQKNNLIQGFNYMESTSSGVTFAATDLNNNLYYDSSNWFVYQGTGEGSFAAWKTATGQDGNAVSSNPNLNGSYIPNTGSPAISAGANLTSLSITPLNSDINGSSRPGGATAWTIGALNAASSSTVQVHQSDSW
jgi:hypothetical protein